MAQRFNMCAERISTYGLKILLKMTAVIAFARCMRVQFIFVWLISWLSLNAAVRPHSADWDEAQVAERVTRAMFPPGCFKLENFCNFSKKKA